MPRISRFKLVVWACIFVLLTGTDCLCGQDDSDKLVRPELLRHAGLRILWEGKLPIQEKETLENPVILGNRIYALSSNNYFLCLDRNTGGFVFGTNLAPAGFSVLGLELYGDELISVVANRLVEIHAETGTELRGLRLDYGVTCPAARNTSFFYVAGADGRLRVYRAKGKVYLFDAMAENDSAITSVIADDNSVVFATEAGNIISMAPDRRERFWQSDAGNGIVHPIVKSDGAIFAASKDTYVYKVDGRTGKWLWRYQTAAILNRGPRVTATLVYQYVHDKGITAIDKTTSSFLWQVDKGAELLAEASGKAYVITTDGELVVMDNRKNRRLYSVNFSPVKRYACNTLDSKLYVADETGRIMCLRPVE
jgi:outer membrane protein assembly factor BamB